MADFIPINAKADISGSKKGKLTPEQNAQVNAWCLTQQTGIFDFGGKCQAEQGSYTATNNVATVVFQGGFISICGRIVECEAGVMVNINTPKSGTETGKIILRFNLNATGTEEFKATTTTASTLKQDNLLLNKNGTYEFELYSYTATSGTVALTRNNTNYIKSNTTALEDLFTNAKKYSDDGISTLETNLTKSTYIIKDSNNAYYVDKIGYETVSGTVTSIITDDIYILKLERVEVKTTGSSLTLSPNLVFQMFTGVDGKVFVGSCSSSLYGNPNIFDLFVSINSAGNLSVSVLYSGSDLYVVQGFTISLLAKIKTVKTK